MATPEIIGPYEVIRPVAQGGMAEVYEVLDPNTGERQALKLLVEARASVKRFNREFEALTCLNHPSIVRVYRYGYHERRPWITMELLDGHPLQSWVKDFGEPGVAERTAEVVRIGYFLAQALQYIHDRGLVHRDLKSANVQVLPDGRVKIIDFGTAHLAHPLERITQEGDFVGTFSYAAPEQIVGASVDHRADLYSLGVLLYRMASGRRPFKASDPQKVAQMHLRSVAKPVREMVPELPEALERLIQWLMEKKRRDRPQSAEEVARSLEEIAGHAITLPGSGFAFSDDRAIGRHDIHRALWHRLDTGPLPVMQVVAGGDLVERTRMADQIGHDAGVRGWRGIVVSGRDDGFGSLISLMRHVASGQGGSDAAAVLAAMGDPKVSARRSLAPLAEGLQSTVVRLIAAHERPTLVVLAEAQLLDSTAVGLLQAMLAEAARAKARMGVVVVADRGDSPVTAALHRSLPVAARLMLHTLDVRDISLAVAELLHRRPPPLEASRRILAASGGRPTTIDAVVRRMIERGEMSVRSDDGNRVEWNPTAGPSTDPPLEDERLDALPAAGRRVLEVLAIAGGEATVRLVAHGIGWEDGATTMLLDDLVDRRCVQWVVRPERVVVWDDALRGSALAAVRPARRAVIEQLVIDGMDAGQPSPALVRALLSVGRSEQALRTGIVCCNELLEHGAVGEALGLMEELRPAANHPGLERKVRAEFHLMYGQCVRFVRPMDGASIRSLHVADSLSDTPEMKARVQLAYAELQGAIGHQGNFRKHLMQGWTLLEGQPPSALAAEIAGLLAWNRVHEGDLAQAGQWFDRSRQTASKARSPLVDRALVGEAHLKALRGDLQESDTILEGVLNRPEADQVARWEAVAERAGILRRQGRFSEAQEALDRAAIEARGGVSPPTFLRILLALAEVELDLARLGSAQEYVDEALATLSRGDWLHVRLSARLLQGRTQLVSGQLGLAQFTLQEVTEQADLAGLVLLAERARGFLAEVRWLLGARKEAMDLYRQSVVRLLEVGDTGSLADVVVSRARSVGGLEDAERSFRVVHRLIERPEFRVLYLESILAEHRWHKASDDALAAQRSLQEAQTVFNGIAARQSRVEQAALRVHPWMREIRRAMG